MDYINTRTEAQAMNELSARRDVLSAQSMYVAKGNALIQKSRYSLSLVEQKAVLFLISKIKPTDEAGHSYIFSIKDFCKTCNFNENSGFYTSYVRQIVEELGKKTIAIDLGEGRTLISHWFSSVIIDANTNSFEVCFDTNLAPYFFQLKSFYTQYSLEYVLPMKSKYSIRLYELLRSVKSKSYRQRFTVEELRERVDCQKYSSYKEFRRNVLEPAIEDINKYTDLDVRYEPIKTGRKITHIEFVILLNSDPERHYNRRRELGATR